MVMGVPNTETGDTSPQGVWLGKCVTRLIESDPGMQLNLAQQEAQELWSACGSTLSAEQAADQWLGREERSAAVHQVVHRDRPAENLESSKRRKF